MKVRLNGAFHRPTYHLNLKADNTKPSGCHAAALAQRNNNTLFGKTLIQAPTFMTSLFGPVLKGIGIGGGFTGAIAGVMSIIEANDLTKLMISDVGGMVIPRTLSELSQRGFDAGREAGFRESMGTLVNVYLAGWFGALGILGFSQLWRNPKALSINAWIPSNRLSMFGHRLHSLVYSSKNNNMTPQMIQEAFIDQALSNIESTDAIPKLKAFSKYFPHQGKLDPKVKDEIKHILMGRKNGFKGIENIEEGVIEELKSPIVQAAWKQEQQRWLQHFRHSNAIAEGTPLIPDRYPTLRNGLKEARQAFFDTQKCTIRKRLTALARKNEKPLLDHIYNLAINKGGVTDEIFFQTSKGSVLNNLGSASLKNYLANIKHFCEEYLNRALTNPITGKLSNRPISSYQARMAQKALFAADHHPSLFRRILPSVKDGLLSYTFKLHRTILMSSMFLTLAIGCSFAYINHNITKKRHHGQVFFPGEQHDKTVLTSMTDEAAFAGYPSGVNHLKRGRV